MEKRGKTARGINVGADQEENTACRDKYVLFHYQVAHVYKEWTDIEPKGTSFYRYGCKLFCFLAQSLQ